MGPKFDLRDLRSFIAVADEENLGRAADRLNMSASPLSRQILQLEARLGLPLFEHSGKRLRLTHSGRQFREQALSLIGHAEEVERAAEEAGRGDKGALTIGYPPGSIWSGYLPFLLQRLRAEAPALAPRLRPVRSHEAAEMLQRGLLDVALVHSLPDGAFGFSSILAHDDPFALVAPRGHRLMTEPPTAPALSEENWIALDHELSPGFRSRFIAACGAYGFLPNIRHEAPDLITVLGLVEAGLGVALLQSAIRRTAPADVNFVALPGFGLSVQLHIVWRPAAASKLTERFVELARQLRVGP